MQWTVGIIFLLVIVAGR